MVVGVLSAFVACGSQRVHDTCRAAGGVNIAGVAGALGGVWHKRASNISKGAALASQLLLLLEACGLEREELAGRALRQHLGELRLDELVRRALHANSTRHFA
jgi:hypothetical protein